MMFLSLTPSSNFLTEDADFHGISFRNRFTLIPTSISFCISLVRHCADAFTRVEDETDATREFCPVLARFAFGLSRDWQNRCLAVAMAIEGKAGRLSDDDVMCFRCP
jgi:hypothetical protein